MNKPTLIAISVTSIQTEPYFHGGRMAQSANIEGKSSDANACFSMKTGLLNDEQLRRCELLKLHGFTVVELPDDPRYRYRGDNAWIDAMIRKALDRIATRYEDKEGVEQVHRYDPEFAEKVLAKVNEHFPTPVQVNELKHFFDEEPSDDKLLLALDGLLCEGFIEGLPMREHTSGHRSLLTMANIKITKEGRQHLSPQHRRLIVPFRTSLSMRQSGRCTAIQWINRPATSRSLCRISKT